MGNCAKTSSCTIQCLTTSELDITNITVSFYPCADSREVRYQHPGADINETLRNDVAVNITGGDEMGLATFTVTFSDTGVTFGVSLSLQLSHML